MSYFSILNAETNSPILHFDFEKSLTYYSKGDNEHHFTTFTLDSERDINMTTFCSGLIWNIIKLRDAHFNNLEKKTVAVIFWNEEIFNNLNKKNIHTNQITFNIKKI